MPKLEIAISRSIIRGKLPCSGAAILLCELTETDGWPGVRSREGDSKYTQFLAIICRWSIILTSWPWAKNSGPASARPRHLTCTGGGLVRKNSDRRPVADDELNSAIRSRTEEQLHEYGNWKGDHGQRNCNELVV